MPLFKIIPEWYFHPRAFEAGSLYPCLGVRLYKKYLPTSGEVVSRIRKIDRLKIIGNGGRTQALQTYELQTRVWESRHLISALLLQGWAVAAGLTIGPIQFWGCTLINLLVNVYPILVQRFNRARITLIIGQQRPNQSLHSDSAASGRAGELGR